MNALWRTGTVCAGYYLSIGGGGWWAVAAEPPARLPVEVAQNVFSAQPASVPSAQPSAAIALPAGQVRWEILARSAEGRPIEFLQFGDGEHQVLVIGSLQGDQPEGLAIAEMLAAHLSRFPRRLSDVTVTIVRDPNPDGRARRTSTNARGVELNRNFQTSGWRQAHAGRGASSGYQPESEPESRAIVELLADLKPERVVLLATTTGRASVSYQGPAETLARQAARDGELQLVPVDAAQEPGSLLTMTGLDRGIPSVRFGLVPRPTADAVWSDVKSGLMTAIGCGTPVDFPRTTTSSSPTGTDSPTAAATATVPAEQHVASPIAAPAMATPSQPSPRQPIGSLTSSPRVVPSPAATGYVGAGAAPRPAIGEAARLEADQTMQFQAIRNGVPNVRVVSPRAGQGVPVVTPTPTTTPLSPPADISPPAEATTTMRFVDSGGISAIVNEQPKPIAPVEATAPAATPTLQRLPTVEEPRPTLPRVLPKNLPQAPIPIYPNTGVQ